jgi:hypothetical protein
MQANNQLSAAIPYVGPVSLANIANVAYRLDDEQPETCSVMFSCDGDIATHVVRSHSVMELQGDIDAQYCCQACLEHDTTHEFRE